MTDMPIVVLAAGQSSRMRGDDKLLQMIDGETLLHRQARIAREVTRGAVLVALPAAPHPRYDTLKGLDVTPIPVPEALEGMNASLRTSFAALPDGVPSAMLLLADLPELTAEDLRLVTRISREEREYLIWRGCTEDGKPGHPIVFSAALFPEFARLSGDGGGREVVAAAGNQVRLVPLPGQRARLDLDTPEEWAEWRGRRGS